MLTLASPPAGMKRPSPATRLVFLDIDGVLNHLGMWRPPFPKCPEGHFDRACIARLDRLVNETGAGIVISSTWRNTFSVEQIAGFMRQNGLSPEVAFLGATPQLETKSGLLVLAASRGREIAAWLSQFEDEGNHVESYVIFDDNLDSNMPSGCAIAVDRNVGLSDRDVARARDILLRPALLMAV